MQDANYILFVTYFPYFEKDKSRFLWSSCCLCVCLYPPINFLMLEQVFMKFDVYHGT
jgi:hypothetical protein